MKKWNTEQELDAYVAAMTVAQKAKQLTQLSTGYFKPDTRETVTGPDSMYAITEEDLAGGIGTVLGAPSAEEMLPIQRAHMEQGEGQIPLAFMIDVIHGFRTCFPIPLALGGSFDTDLVERCAEESAREAKYEGTQVTFSPMLDLVRDARWGRVMESTGEDSYLNGEMGKAFIRGYHKGGIASCIKHFAAYGAAEAGREYNTTDISEHALREYYLRAYEECIRNGDADMVMTSFNLLNGIPVNAHSDLLLDTLRGEWGFDGVVITDHRALPELITHGYCETERECALIAANNEIDIDMGTATYIHHIEDLVKSGDLSEDRLNRMVKRVLRLKEKLGLFEDPYGGISHERFKKLALSAEARALAREAAEKCTVLLKNKNAALPLRREERVALIGPFAEGESINGFWTCTAKWEESVSVREGIEALLGRKIPVARGCDTHLTEENYADIPAAVSVAADPAVETVILCIGEPWYGAGEANSRAKIAITRPQAELARALAALGKKLVTVVFGGRPQVLTEIEPLADALLYAWQPGSEGGSALARILYGDASPSAKLTMSFPRSVGQCPIYYNAFNTNRPKIGDELANNERPAFTSNYRDEYNAPLYPFGYGLTYTDITVKGLRLSATEMNREGHITATVTVSNHGTREGTEVVQWYLRDFAGSCCRPIKELKGYERVTLAPGESRTVSFTVTDETLRYYTASGVFCSEKGRFALMVGNNSRDTESAEFYLK